jgi:hypothetical protein
MRREQLINTEQYVGYLPETICYYCGKKLTEADHTENRKFGFRGWSKKNNKLEWYCWNCH